MGDGSGADRRERGGDRAWHSRPVSLDVLLGGFALDDDDDEDATSRTSASTCDAVAVLPGSYGPEPERKGRKRNRKVPMHLREKKGGVCCCLVDFRRAVIIASGVCLALSTVIFLTFVSASASRNHGSLDDDEYLGALTVQGNEYLSAFFAIEILAASLAIAGAMRYNSYPVAFHALWLIASWTSMVVLLTLEVEKLKEFGLYVELPVGQFIVFGACVMALVYPHLRLMAEFKMGIMTRRTYPREAYDRCGCCLPRKHRQRQIIERTPSNQRELLGSDTQYVESIPDSPQPSAHAIVGSNLSVDYAVPA